MYVMVPQYRGSSSRRRSSLRRPGSASSRRHRRGSLVLHVKPDDTQVFVDGYYVGAADDFGGDRGGTFLEERPAPNRPERARLRAGDVRREDRAESVDRVIVMR